MNRFTAICVLFVVTTGCDVTPAPVPAPPMFNYGDTVKPTGVDRVCIVTGRQLQDGCWKYTVMHQDVFFVYNQTELTLNNRFDWTVPGVDWEKVNNDSVNGKAEIETTKEIP